LVEGEGELEEIVAPSGLKVCEAIVLAVLGMIGVLLGEDSGTTTTTCEVVVGVKMVSGG
jgi:hypothetical protein